MNVHDPSLYKYGVPPHTPRSMTNFLASIHGDTPLVCAEVGVLEGANAASILTLLNIERLYLVDPYREYVNMTPDEPHNVIRNNEQMTEIKGLAHQHLTRWLDRIVWLEDTSESASTGIPDNILDFVYIDGQHTLDITMNDIRRWYPKVKVGGYIGGHDYQPIEGGYEVIEAVGNMCREYGLEDKGYDYYQRYASPGIPQCDWWVEVI